MSPELSYYIALTLIPSIGHVTAKHLVSYCGGAKEVFNTSRQQLLRIPDVGPKTVDIIMQQGDDLWQRVEKEMKFIVDNDITPIVFFEKNYPQRFKSCHNSSTVLYYKGNAPLNPARCISIIGTRNATDYGKEICEQLIADLAALDPNICVMSGLAYGIDALVHRACVKHQLPTIGVVAHGLDRIYPPAHADLARKMTNGNGGILTDLLSGTLPEPENFPQRNRIVAGMADATVVVQTNTKGGSLITVEYAHSYGRDIFAFPGKVNDPYSSGCHQLIRAQRAILVTCATDITDALSWNKLEKDDKNNHAPQAQLFVELSEVEQRVMAILQRGKPKHITEIMSHAQITHSMLAATLLGLEFKGLLRTQPGSMYVGV